MNLFFKSALILLIAVTINAEQNQALTKDEVKTVVMKVAKHLKDSYVFEKEGQLYYDGLVKELEKKIFDDIKSPGSLASLITDSLDEVFYDAHLSVGYYPPRAGEKAAEELPEALKHKRWLAQKQKENWGFEELKFLEDGLAYTKINYFDGSPQAFEKAVAMMGYIDGCTGLVIDLRTTWGGDGRMGLFLSSYFIPGRERWLLSHVNRSEGKNNQEWSLPFVPGKKQEKIPVYLLVSSRTFSAAEAFAYAMKSIDRAVLIGETTGGGAHAGTYKPLGHHLQLFLPAGQILSPITKTNWEGKGVKPHINSSRREALKVAVKEHAKYLNKNDEDKTYSVKLEWQKQHFEALKGKTTKLKAEALRNCTGQYADKHRIDILNGSLVYTSPEGKLFSLAYLKDDTFFAKGVGEGNDEANYRFIFPDFQRSPVKQFNLQYMSHGSDAVEELVYKRGN